MSITIDDAIKQAKAMAACVGKHSDDYALLAATDAAGTIPKRIHNQSKDANGNSLGGYSEGYKKVRRRANRFTTKKDLQLTDQLFESYGIFKVNGDIVFGIKSGIRKDGKISNQRLAVLIEENEDKEIFFASKQEIKLIDKAVNNRIIKDWNKCFNQF